MSQGLPLCRIFKVDYWHRGNACATITCFCVIHISILYFSFSRGPCSLSSRIVGCLRLPYLKNPIWPSKGRYWEPQWLYTVSKVNPTHGYSRKVTTDSGSVWSLKRRLGFQPTADMCGISPSKIANVRYVLTVMNGTGLLHYSPFVR